MLINICKAKIHRATLTDANINYEGSITIDSDLMKAADLVPYEKVQVANVTNGERLETYVIKGVAGSGVIALNGAAARKGNIGDIIIIIAYGIMEREKADSFKPKIVKVDKNNKII
jgi:aspartate 1-decarboxylase